MRLFLSLKECKQVEEATKEQSDSLPKGHLQELFAVVVANSCVPIANLLPVTELLRSHIVVAIYQQSVSTTNGLCRRNGLWCALNIYVFHGFIAIIVAENILLNGTREAD